VASPSSGSDNLAINGPIVSSNGNIDLTAGSRIVLGSGGSVSAPYGTVTLKQATVDEVAAKGNEKADDNTTTSLTTATAKIAPAEDSKDKENKKEDEDERKKKKQGGEQTTDDRKKDDSPKNYCN
jgi:hypothetical protein